MPSSFPANPRSSGAYPYHEEYRGSVRVVPEHVFAYLDDHTQLSGHMSRRSWRMGGARMALHTDDRHGRAVGSRIHLDGSVLGLRLWLEEEVVERVPSVRKVWETLGTPRLLVIGPYRMGFELAPEGGQAEATGVRVFIDYELPMRGLPQVLGRLLGRWYARWCVERMVTDAQAALT